MTTPFDTARHEALVPQGTQVASKGRWRNCKGFGPDWIVGGEGARVWDDRGRRWIDWSCGLGAITLGHGSHGISGRPACYPVAHPVELELAEKVHGMVPCAEKVRFLKTGTDATTAAIRLARTFTGRDLVCKIGNYHGWADWSCNPLDTEGIPRDVSKLTPPMPWFFTSDFLRDFAAVILEPISLEYRGDGYLERLRAACTESGAILIFDEVITGFRMHPGGAQSVYGVTPDLCCMGKALGNGWPISLVAGRADIMDAWSRTHISGTHYADPACMLAATENLHRMAAGNFWSHQDAIGGRLLSETRKMVKRFGLERHVQAVGHPHWWVLRIPDAVQQTYFQQECIRRGVLGSNGSHFVSMAHAWDDVNQTLTAYEDALGLLQDSIVKGDTASRLECEVNKTVFRRA